MAKKNKSQMKDMDEVKEKKAGKLQWFLFVIVIPLIFAILVSIIILSLSGVNVFEKANELSNKVSSMFQSEEKQKEKTTTRYKKEIVDLQAEIKDKEAEIQSLEKMIDSRDQNVQQAEAQIQQLQQEIQELQTAKTETQNSTNANATATNISKTYEMMSPKKSAPIIAQMNDGDAVAILENLKEDTLAKVLEQMTPEDAARLTNKLK